MGNLVEIVPRRVQRMLGKVTKGWKGLALRAVSSPTTAPRKTTAMPASIKLGDYTEYSLNLRFVRSRSFKGEAKTLADQSSGAESKFLRGEKSMVRRIFLTACCVGMMACFCVRADQAEAQQAYGRAWGQTYTTQDWNRFYHYPYVYYPQNFWGNEYYRSADSLYHRYPSEMRIPVYNRHWHNYYPNRRRFHSGHQFVLDVF